MFERTKTYYVLFEGLHANDNSMVTEFTSKTKAEKAFSKSTYAYAVIHVYNGTPDDHLANYVGTIKESR